MGVGRREPSAQKAEAERLVVQRCSPFISWDRNRWTRRHSLRLWSEKLLEVAIDRNDSLGNTSFQKEPLEDAHRRPAAQHLARPCVEVGRHFAGIGHLVDMGKKRRDHAQRVGETLAATDRRASVLESEVDERSQPAVPVQIVRVLASVSSGSRGVVNDRAGKLHQATVLEPQPDADVCVVEEVLEVLVEAIDLEKRRAPVTHISAVKPWKDIGLRCREGWPIFVLDQHIRLLAKDCRQSSEELDLTLLRIHDVGSSADPGYLGIHIRFRNLTHPGTAWHRVVVDERDNLTGGMRETEVARGRKVELGTPHDADTVSEIGGQHLKAVVPGWTEDYNDLKIRIALVLERSK